MSDKIQQPLFRQSAPSIGFSPPVPPFFNTTNYTVPQLVNSEHTIAQPLGRTVEVRPIVPACTPSNIVQPTPLSAMSSREPHSQNDLGFNLGLPGHNQPLNGVPLNVNTLSQLQSPPLVHNTNIPPTVGTVTDIEDTTLLGSSNITKPQTSFYIPPNFPCNNGDRNSGANPMANQKCNTVWDQNIPATFKWGNTANMNEDFGSTLQNSYKSRRIHTKRKAARDSPIPNKMLITEKEMAKRIGNLNLDGAPTGKNKSIFSDLDPTSTAQQQLDEIDRRLEAIEDEEDDGILEEEMTEDIPRLQLSDEVKKSLNMAAELLPHNLLDKIPPSPSPNMQVVLWRPNNDIVKEVIQSALNYKNRKRGTSPTAVETVNQSNGISVTLNSMDGIEDAPSIPKSLPYDNINKRGQQESLPMDAMDE